MFRRVRADTILSGWPPFDVLPGGRRGRAPFAGYGSGGARTRPGIGRRDGLFGRNVHVRGSHRRLYSVLPAPSPSHPITIYPTTPLSFHFGLLPFVPTPLPVSGLPGFLPEHSPFRVDFLTSCPLRQKVLHNCPLHHHNYSLLLGEHSAFVVNHTLSFFASIIIINRFFITALCLPLHPSLNSFVAYTITATHSPPHTHTHRYHDPSPEDHQRCVGIDPLEKWTRSLCL